MTQNWEGFKKPNFGPPPPGYIAGYGRGATGFITRSDIGPAKMQQNPFLKQRQLDDANYSDAKYDEWSGYSAPLFTANQLDEEDREAQETYNQVDMYMDGRRKQQRQQLIKSQMQKAQTDKPSISQQFSDLKRGLVGVSYDDWLNLPESIDLARKKRKKQRFTPVPDTMVAEFVNQNKLENKQVIEGVNDLGQAKNILLESKLDQASGSVSALPKIDKVGYITSLNCFKASDEAYLGDLKKARLLLKSAISTNPKNAETWVSAARVEELDGKIQQARVLINEGLQYCATSQDLWLEAARLEKEDEAKNLLSKAVRILPKSQKIWIAASRKQSDVAMKRRILRKALEHNSNSVRLWKQLIEHEDQNEAKSLLYKAVQCLPKEVQLWLALARLQTYEKAKAVINSARRANPLQAEIYICAAKLEETQGSNLQQIEHKVDAILSKARETLQKNGCLIKRSDWIQHAQLCQKTNNLITCKALIKLCGALDVDPLELESTVDKDAADMAERGSIETARFMYLWGINKLNSKRLIEKAIAFERSQKSQEHLENILKLAVEKCGDGEDFWIAIADKYTSSGDLSAALDIIERGLQTPKDTFNKEGIMLKKAKIFMKMKKITETEEVLRQAREQHGIKSWLASIKLQYRKGNFSQAWRLCDIVYKKQKNQKLFQLAFKIQQKVGTYESSRAILEKGVEQFDKSIPLWLMFIQHQIDCGYPAKARTILERAKVKNAKCQQLHQAAVRLQLQSNNQKGAIFCLAKGLTDCPKSGLLWSLAIEIQPRSTRKKKASDGMSACPEDSSVNLAVAKIFWKQRKYEKAKKWIEKAIELNPHNGDAWVYLYKFLLENEKQLLPLLVQKIRLQDLSQGRLWRKIRKDDDGWNLSTEQILQRVLKQIQKDMATIQ